MSVKLVRSLLRQFYGIGATPTYHYVNTGFVKVNEENSPEMDDSAFVGDVNGSPSVIGYKNKFSFEAQVHEGEAVIDDILTIARGQKTGSDCERIFVDVDMNKADGAVSGSYYARKFTIAVEATPPAGDPKSITTLGGTFHQSGDLTAGTFDVQSRTFAAA